ncbi:MAG TPA: cytochrome c [Allosphingosinicella sp.]|jgi:cytochrome c oxidase cbb3-type subunit 3|nr:cytochrome c [Allosphingosinicella sp.]
MSSLFPASAALLCTFFLLAGCDREERGLRHQAKAETMAFVPSGDPRANDYQNNAFQLSQGQRLFGWMNCVGCHSHGGGGMGPPLMDNKWRYGGRMEDIVYTILNGRPNGMPPFKGRVTQQQAWQLAAYVHSLSIQTRKDVLGARTEEMSNVEPPTLQSPRTPINEPPAPGHAPGK